MNEARADFAQLPENSWPAAPPPARESWSATTIIFLIGLAFAAHLALIFIFADKKNPVPRAATNVPQLQIADVDNELIALDDPTLFALPHANDFATAFWQRPPADAAKPFGWREPPRYLPVAAHDLGTLLGAFVQTNPPVKFALDFQPPPLFTELASPVFSASPVSSFEIAGDLAERDLLNRLDSPALAADGALPNNLPPLPGNDVIAPSRVQVLADAAGQIISAVLLETSGSATADAKALELARNARFAPAAQMTFGEMIFNWHTLPANAKPSTTLP